MDGSKFDALTKGLAAGRSRRALMRGLVGVGAALLASRGEATLAKRRVEGPHTVCHFDVGIGAHVELQVPQSGVIKHLWLHPGDSLGPCQQCVPNTCAQFACGENPDGCGGLLDCGCCNASDCGTNSECITYRCRQGMCLTGTQDAVDCQYGDWSAWSACSVECGAGIVTRSRMVLAEASCGGAECDKSTLAEQAPCTLQPCNCGIAPPCQPGDCGPILDNCGRQVDFCIDHTVTCTPGVCGPLRDRCGTQFSTCVDDTKTCGPGDCGTLYDDCGNPVGDCGPCG